MDANIDDDFLSAFENLRLMALLKTDNPASVIKELEISGKVLEKNAALSIEARKEGNALFTNKGHDSHIHKKILDQYSKSIAFAPDGTEELVLGYSNRSVLLMHLHRYKESLVDIDKAMRLTESDDYKKKLQDRKEKCLKLMKEKDLEESVKNLTVSENKDLKNLATKLMKFKRSATLPNASKSVGLAYNNNFGRHLIATQDIKPGEILIVEEGYVCYPKPSFIYTVCCHCLQVAWNGIPCDDCVFAIFCSEACKNEALKLYHDIECCMLKYMNCITDRIFYSMTAMRLLITAARKESFKCVINEAQKKTLIKCGFESLLSNGILHPDKFKSYYNLLFTEQDFENERLFINLCVPVMIYLLSKNSHFVNLVQESFSSDVVTSQMFTTVENMLIKIFSIINTNAYGYQAITDCQCEMFRYCKINACESKRGGFLSSTCSLLNHSCIPNVNRIFVPKRKVIIFANNPIKKGEQLFIDYSAHADYIRDLKERQSRLKQYHFTCQCMACKDDFNAGDKSILQTDAAMKGMEMVSIEYYLRYFKELSRTFISGPANKLIYSEELFEEVKTVTELLYKHHTYGPAFVYNHRSVRYFIILFLKLYGEKYVIPNDC